MWKSTAGPDYTVHAVKDPQRLDYIILTDHTQSFNVDFDILKIVILHRMWDNSSHCVFLTVLCYEQL